jgi:hypothetical protein
MVADVFPMVTNIYLMVAEESSVANPHQVGKIDEKIRNVEQKLFGNTALANELPNFLANIGHISTINSIGFHRLTIIKHRKTLLALVGYPMHFRSLVGKLASATRCYRYQIPNFKLSQIVISCHQSPNVPGLVTYMSLFSLFQLCVLVFLSIS